jgi:hypothetical protein
MATTSSADEPVLTPAESGLDQSSLTDSTPAALARTTVAPTNDNPTLSASGRHSVSAADARPRPKQPAAWLNDNAGNNAQPNRVQSPTEMLTMLSGIPAGTGASFVPAKNTASLQTAPLGDTGTATQPLAHGRALLLREPPPAMNPHAGNQATPEATAPSSNDSKNGNTGEIAFAVKVAAPKASIPVSRTSAADTSNSSNATGRQTASGKTAAAAPENAETADGSETNDGGRAKDNGADQSVPAKDASAKADQRMPVGDGSLQQDAAAAATSFAISPIAGGPPADGTGAAGNSTPTTPGAPATLDNPAADQQTRPAGLMKDISVRVENSQGQNVDVRIVQRAGDLQIAVKSANLDTTQSLRNGLSELTNRLNASGYQAETWKPGLQAAASSESSSGSGNSSDQPPSGDSQSNSSWSQQNQGQRDNNPSNRPRWISELESRLTSGAESTGQFYGFVS